MSENKVCVVVGVGPGNGAAFARRFAKEGYAVALLARKTETTAALAKSLPNARAYACDVADRASVAKAFAAIRSEMGEVDVLVYNAGSGVWGTIEEIDPAVFEQSFKVNALGLLTTSREVIPAMKAKKHGAIIIVGATASRRGVAKTAGFAPAKAAQKSLAESMARHLWKEKIHVALIIVDGIIDSPGARKYAGDKPESFFLKPDDIAETAYRLTEQPSSAWSFEVEARPFSETW